MSKEKCLKTMFQQIIQVIEAQKQILRTQKVNQVIFLLLKMV